ncbi:MAG: T9SS type A sorting domain-containing protein [Balneola sp.]
MAEPLQNKALFRTLHIALFFFVILITKSSYAQSLLLPGDIVFVSVNSTTDQFELVPLIDLEIGTEFNVSNGLWDNSDLAFSQGQEVKFTVKKKIEAGTPFKFTSKETEYLKKNGSIILSEEREQLFIYQKDNEQTRFVYALGWGEKKGRRDRSFFGSDIPEVLKDNKNTVLRLGTENNYQYYIRNGASGTQKMLLSFVSNVAYWRGNNEAGYSDFGTSFNLLKAPVILFDESLSSVKENEKKTILNVAIYEHDGSKLTVDVVFDSLYSSLSRNEINGFRSKKINFTGLIGDAVYEVEVPLEDDKDYEGFETGIFSLQNLSTGRFGDFISHTVMVSDNELPEIKFEIIENLNKKVLVLHNLESRELDLRDWELVKGDIKVVFPRNTSLKVGESIVILAGEDQGLFSNSLLLDNEKAELLNSNGTIHLKNYEGTKIAEVSISKKEENSNSLVSSGQVNSNSPEGTKGENPNVVSAISETVNPGWKTISNTALNVSEFPSTDFFYWNKNEGSFKNVSESSSEEIENNILVGYFDEASAKKFAEIKKKSLESISGNTLDLNIEATDADENGIIQSTEGLNLVSNNTSGTFSSVQLTTVLKSRLELTEEISVFKSSPEFGKISALKEDELIFPGDIFWLKFNVQVPERKISLELQELNIDPIIEERERGIFELELNGSSKSSNLQVSFVEEEASLNKLNLKLNEELYLSDFNELVLAANLEGNHYDQLDIEKDSKHITTLPLDISSDKSGEFEFKVKEWTDIPDGWVIQIEDLKEEKIYEIHDNWSLKFNYSNMSVTESDNVFFPSVEDRFVLKMIPKELVDTGDELPITVELHQNYPNPFNPTTTISFYMPEEGLAKLSVFNIVGQPVAVLLQENKAQGEHSFEWDASDMPSGIYIYQLEVGTKIMTRKMTLVK